MIRRARWWLRLGFELVIDLVLGSLEKKPAPPAPAPTRFTPAQVEAVRRAASRRASDRPN